MEYKDYYKILGISRDADADAIKRAYRKLARQFHPDKNKSKGAEDKFKEANEAHEVLSDPTKRKAYDQLGANWRAGQSFTPPPGWESQFRGFGRGGAGGFSTGGDFSDFFSTLFGNAGPGGPFGTGGFRGGENEGFMGFGGGARRQDQRATLVVDLEDSYAGATRTVQLGSGRALSVKIPKGIADGQTMRLAGQGAHGGDLLLEIKFAPHAQFKVEGREVHTTLALAPWEAALGAKLPVRTLGGTIEMNVPSGSQTGRRLRLKGRGLPGEPAGDQIVTLEIMTPPATTPDERAAYEELAKRFPGFKPR